MAESSWHVPCNSWYRRSNNIADRENMDELRTIKAALDRLEEANTFDIYAESEE